MLIVHRRMLEQAIKIYSARKCTLNELARTTYKRGQLLSAMGNEPEAQLCWSDAYKMRCSIIDDGKRSALELNELDYDKLVIFWNR